MKNFNTFTFFNQLTAMPKRLAMVLTVLFTLGVGSMLGETATYTWDLTSSSADWTSSSCETYFSQPYGMKKVNAYIINKSIDDFENYAATATSIQIGVKSLCNGGTSSKLTISLVDKDGNTIGSGQIITPENKTSAASTTYQYVTFTSNLETATGYKIQCTTYGKNVLVNGSSYKITYEDSSSGGSGGGGSSSGTGTITFGTDHVRIDAASVSGVDDLENTWTITTVTSSSSFTQQPTYSQVGSSNKPATSITFTTTLPKEVTITKFSAKFGGFSSTAGNVTLKVGDTSVGTGKLNATSDVTVTNTTEATGKVLTVTVTGIAKGVKVYNISYTYESVISVQTYTITWKNGETTLETDENVEVGTTPTYNGATPTKAATAQYTYTFAGWDPEISTVTGDQTYTAKFTETLRTYTITWKNGDNVLETDNNVEYGATPQYNGANPTKAATAQYTYAFTGWHPAIASVTKDQTYTAQFSQTVNKYTITWKNADGTILKTEEVAYGTTPSYTGTTPTKVATEQYTYTHNGWTPNVVAVTDNTTYTATFTETPRTYTITLNTNDGTINAGNVTSYKYGVGATLPTNVTKENHQFGGWFDNSGCTGTAVTAISTTATGNKVYWAKWTELPKYTVTWMVDKEKLSTEDVYEGAKWSSLTLPTAPNPNDYCGQVFAGWTTTNIGSTGLDKDNDATAIQNLNLMTSENKSSKTNTITGDITFYAVFADYAD